MSGVWRLSEPTKSGLSGREAWRRVWEIADRMPFRMRSKFLWHACQYVKTHFSAEAQGEYSQAMYDAGYHR